VVLADHLVDVRDPVAPAQVRVQVGEQQACPARGQLPGAVGGVGLQYRRLQPASIDGTLASAVCCR